MRNAPLFGGIFCCNIFDCCQVSLTNGIPRAELFTGTVYLP